MVLASAAAPGGAWDKVDVVVLDNGDRITCENTDWRFWTSLGYSFQPAARTRESRAIHGQLCPTR
jgi:hypothetical protein